jgi:hypothetical protein
MCYKWQNHVRDHNFKDPIVNLSSNLIILACLFNNNAIPTKENRGTRINYYKWLIISNGTNVCLVSILVAWTLPMHYELMQYQFNTCTCLISNWSNIGLLPIWYQSRYQVHALSIYWLKNLSWTWYIDQTNMY